MKAMVRANVPLAVCSEADAQRLHLRPMSWASNTSVSLGGIAGGKPEGPYATSGVHVSLALSPTDIFGNASSKATNINIQYSIKIKSRRDRSEDKITRIRTSDHLTHSNLKLEWLPPVHTAIELLPCKTQEDYCFSRDCVIFTQKQDIVDFVVVGLCRVVVQIVNDTVRECPSIMANDSLTWLRKCFPYSKLSKKIILRIFYTYKTVCLRKQERLAF